MQPQLCRRINTRRSWRDKCIVPVEIACEDMLHQDRRMTALVIDQVKLLEVCADRHCEDTITFSQGER